MMETSDVYQIYEIFQHLKYRDIINFYQCNSYFNGLKRYPLFQKLLIEKRIEYYTDNFPRVIKNRFATIPDDTPATPEYVFIYACYRGDLEVVREMLKQGVDPTANKNKAIGYASFAGNTEIVKLLLSDIRVNPIDNCNYALEIAVQTGKIEVVDLLLGDIRVRTKLYTDGPGYVFENLKYLQFDRNKYPNIKQVFFAS